jgi:alkanesulfonate monooxygenase SsuD/methylene tetrahydromethanopterin reductase-like flavin-dependent oxidoreductase (luciferase family)
MAGLTSVLDQACPPPVQKPRPPLMIGAQGPRMLNITARYADTWNTFGGFARTSEEMLADTRKRSARLDAHCAEIGRDPQSLRRSLLVYGVAGQRMFSSIDGFEEVFKRYREIGINSTHDYIEYYYEKLPLQIP